MYCSECGEKLTKANQKFCHNCGTKIQYASNVPEYKTEPIKRETPSNIYYVPVKPQMQLQKGRPGKYSNLCFGLALGSLVVGIISFVIGYYYNYMSMFYYMPDPYESVSYEKIMERVAVLIVILFLRIGGLIMGISSRVSATKAQKLEPYNDIEKAGSILVIFGILINSLGLFLSFLGPWTIFRIPTYY